jgi:hypothetical protein
MYSLYSIMKKTIVLTVRVDEEINSVIQTLAEEEDRTVAWIIRKLIDEALEARGLKSCNRPPGQGAKAKRP